MKCETFPKVKEMLSNVQERTYQALWHGIERRAHRKQETSLHSILRNVHVEHILYAFVLNKAENIRPTENKNEKSSMALFAI